jgi:hypothetical protein
MSSESEHGDNLAKLAARLDSLPEVEQPPKTSLSIINNSRREIYWNQFLRYFLDPSEPHGLEADLLKQFLRKIEKKQKVEIDTDEFDDVSVEAEVESSEGNRPDLVIYEPESWFVCIELKVDAQEGSDQTIRYFNDSEIADTDKSKFDGNEAYIFIAPQDGATPVCEEFSLLYWRTVVDVINEVLLNSLGKYSNRGTAQLTEFRDTIAKVTFMTEDEFNEVQQKRAEAYIDFYETIRTVEDAFEDFHQREINRWHNRFPEEFEGNLPGEWNCAPGKHGRIYKDGWRVDEQGNPVDDQEPEYCIEFQHHIKKEFSFSETRVSFRLYSSSRSNNEYRNRFKELWNGKYDERVRDALNGTGIKKKKTRKTYTRQRKEYHSENVPDGYYSTLKEIFEVHLNIVPIVDKIHEEVVNELIENR